MKGIKAVGAWGLLCEAMQGHLVWALRMPPPLPDESCLLRWFLGTMAGVPPSPTCQLGQFLLIPLPVKCRGLQGSPA